MAPLYSFYLLIIGTAFLLIAFLNSFSIFIASLLNLRSNRLEESVSLFFQGIFLVLLIGSGFSAASSYFYF